MVCRDAKLHRAREVNPLVLSSPEERSLYALGERMFLNPNFSSILTFWVLEMRQRRKSNALRSLSRVPPSSEEAAELHTFMLQHGHGQLDTIPEKSMDHVLMGDTVLEKCMLMFPQERKCVEIQSPLFSLVQMS